MKKVFGFVFLFLNLFMLTITVMAQNMHFINYQAVARNWDGNVLANQNVSITMNIRKFSAGGLIEYSEIHHTTTNSYGLFTLQIGNGVPLVNTYTDIQWFSELDKYLEVLLDPDGAAGPTPPIYMGAQKLVSVPYALFAKEVKWFRYNAGSDHLSIGNNNNSNGANTCAIGLNTLGNSTGSHNVGLGTNALVFNTTGFENTAIGANALNFNTTGSQLTAIGRFANVAANNLTNATAIGAYALVGASNAMVLGSIQGVNGANHNTFVGIGTTTPTAKLEVAGGDARLNGITVGRGGGGGSGNAIVGLGALVANTTGNNNTAMGNNALFSNTTGNNNTALGYNAYPITSSVSNYTAVGYNVGSAASVSNMVEIGNASVSVIRGQVGFTTYSDARIKDKVQQNVPGLAFINQLKPVTYNLNIHRQNQIMYGNQKPDTLQWAGKYDIEKIRMTGFIAQEVATTAQELGFDFSGVVPPQNEHDLYSLRYAEFVVPLVKAVQEQQAMIEELKKELLTQRSQIKQLLLNQSNHGTNKH